MPPLTRTKDRNHRRNAGPWTRGEKWLLVSAVIAIAASVVIWTWIRSLDAMPVCVVPRPQTIYPNAYSYFVAASGRAPVQFGTRITKSTYAPPMDPHPETWLTRAPKSEDMQAVAGAPAANAAGLALLRNGLTLPCLAPQMRSFNYLRPELARLRGLARAVRATAEVQAAQGRDADAVATSLDGVSMGVEMSRGSCDITILVGAAICAINRRTIWHIADRLDAATARSAALRLATLELHQEPITKILTNQKWFTQAALMEIFQQADWRKQLHNASGMESGEESNYNNQLMFVGKRDLLDAYTRQADAAIAAASGSYRDMRLSEDIAQPHILKAFTSETEAVWFKWCQGAADNRLLATTLALKAYHREHGSYPSSLQQLVPAYLPAVLEDPFSGVSLHYKRDHQSYLLYSVGPDKQDDGGKPISTISRTRNYYVERESRGDMVAGLNE